MCYRIAVGTNDGNFVTEHFGRCAVWTIIEVAGDSWRVAQKRELFPGMGGHDDEAIRKTVAGLEDCRAVLVRKIGPGAERRLTASGIAAFEVNGPISDAIEKLTQYYKRIDNGKSRRQTPSGG
ncbi:MAG: hypothetical protein LBQ58_06605 [Synergistaceae bacterium]|jgi:predicted Fe-Mo cluster-binding NifX family protein|nr:hypothetical protein [Synergistaceae bacterium]